MNFISTKKRLLKLLACLAVICLVSSQQGFSQINSFPYNEDFEGETNTNCNPQFTTCGGTYNMVTPGWANTGAGTDWQPDCNGSTSGSTGPSGPGNTTTGGVDHNPGTTTGKYMYLETSGSCNTQTAILETPVFDFTSAAAPQLDFWYHMYGTSMGTLNFEVSTNGGGTWTNLWNSSGNQGNVWLNAVINIAAYGGMNNVQFRFRGVTGTSFTSDMAIDDLSVKNILPNNAGISAMLSPTLGQPAGSYPVDVTLENFGSNALNNVNIEWEINGAPQTPVTYSGPAVAAFASTTVNLSASTAFASGVTNLKFWTSMPNGVADADNGNDTLNTIFCTGLAGTYTVGTPTSDFPTIQDALNALFGCGVGGPVTLQVAAGTYSALTINQPVPGISATNTVTWDGSALAATISVTGGAAVTFDNASYMTIQNFTIANSSTTTGWGVLLTNASSYINILNNRIQMASTTAFNTAGVVATGSPTNVTTNGNNCNYTVIEGNTITGADRGISLRGNSSIAQYNSGNVIRNNDISDADNYGIYTYYQDSMLIEGNYIHEFPSTFHYGIYDFYSMNSDVIGNDIRAIDYGLYMNRTNSQTTPTRQGIVANNMVQSEDDRAVYMVFTRSTDFYHNTIVCLNRSAAVWSNWDNTVDVKNNIFVSHSPNGLYYAFETFSTTAFTSMDNNVFYTDPANPNLIDFSSNYSDLADWQANGPYGYDANSLEGLPQFYSATDLHVDGAFLNDKGAVTTTVLTDFDGETRPATGAANVDIGADEFTPPSNDAGVTDLASPTLPISGGFSAVEINVRNFGIADLTTFSVEWEIDGNAQVPVPYTGSPIPVGASTTMILANINFPQSTTSLKFWTTMPNGMPDERTSNDTLELNLCPGLAGTYTVGHPSSDFPTITSAVDALMSCGVSAAVVMEFQPGTYTGPWVFNEIPGTSMSNTVTFDGLNHATVSHDATGAFAATVVMDGVDYFIIKNFNIENTGLNTAYGVLLTNDANYNGIEDNMITVPVQANITNVVGVLASASMTASIGTSTEGNNANYTMIKGNDISGGTAGIILEGGITNNGQFPSFENLGNQIVDNYIHDADDYGIYADEQDTFTVSGNKIDNIVASTSDAIMLFDVHNYQILANDVTSRDYGIAIFGGFSNGDEVRNGLVANNMVACASAGEAFYLREANNCYIYHNTFSGMPACYLDNHINIDLRNNILTTANSYCFYTLDPVSMSGMDHNMFHITSPVGIAVRFGTTNYTSLNDWQTNGPAGYDANSVAGNPNYINGLHVGGSIPVDTADMTIAVPIMTDIDGEARPMGPKNDIGADEHVVIGNDATVVALVSPMGCGSAAHDIIVSVANVGAQLQISAPVTVNVTGDATGTYNATQPLLAPGSTINMNLGQMNTEAGGTYNFEIIISVGTDQNPSNDTLNVTVTIPPSNQLALSMTGDNLVCEGNTATISATASYAPATIYWYDAAVGGNLVHVGPTFMDGPLTAPVTYYAEIQGCNSPRAMTTVDLDTMGINVDLGPDITVCGGQGAEIYPTVTISPEVSTVWSEGSQSAFIEVTAAGQYWVMVENANGCSDMDTIDVAVTPTPTIANNSNNVSCGGYADGNVDLTITGGTGPFTFDWSNGTTTEDLSNVAGGVYVVTVTDNGPAGTCVYVESYQLTEPTVMSANIDAVGVACSGTDGTVDITVSGGTPGYLFNWSNGETTEDIANATPGTQTVTVTDANACTFTTSATIAATTPITVTVDTIFDEILNLQGSIEITAGGGSGNFQFVWNNGATTDDVTGLTAGTYSVTVTDMNTGCQFVQNNIVVAYKIPDFVNNIPSLDAFKLYPNPTSGQVWVNMTLAETTTVQLEITSVTGQLLQSFAPRESLEQNYQIDMSEYPSGIYMARFIIGNKVMTTKVIVE